jgi:hypothetical protein
MFLGLIFRRDPIFKLPDNRQAGGNASGRSHLTPILSLEERITTFPAA